MAQNLLINVFIKIKKSFIKEIVQLVKMIIFEVQYYSKIVSNENLFPNEGVGDRTTGANWSGNLKGQTARANIQAAGNDIYSDTDGSKNFGIIGYHDSNQTK